MTNNFFLKNIYGERVKDKLIINVKYTFFILDIFFEPVVKYIFVVSTIICIYYDNNNNKFEIIIIIFIIILLINNKGPI